MVERRRRRRRRERSNFSISKFRHTQWPMVSQWCYYPLSAECEILYFVCVCVCYFCSLTCILSVLVQVYLCIRYKLFLLHRMCPFSGTILHMLVVVHMYLDVTFHWQMHPAAPSSMHCQKICIPCIYSLNCNYINYANLPLVSPSSLFFLSCICCAMHSIWRIQCMFMVDTKCV